MAELEISEVHEDFIVRRKRISGKPQTVKPIHPGMKLKAIKLAREEGLDDNSIARALGFQFEKFLLTMTKDPVFRARLVVARDDHHIATVEESLYQRAKGYTISKQVRKLREIKDDEGNVVDEKFIPVKEVDEHFPAEVSALKEYLHNRAPDRWAAKNTEDTTGRQNITIQIVNYGSDTDPNSIQILPKTISVAIPESDAEGTETGCLDLAPTNGQGQNLP